VVDLRTGDCRFVKEVEVEVEVGVKGGRCAWAYV